MNRMPDAATEVLRILRDAHRRMDALGYPSVSVDARERRSDPRVDPATLDVMERTAA